MADRVHPSPAPGTTTRTGGFFAAGVGWDLIHRFDDGAAPGRVHLVYVRGDRNLAFIPQRWHGADRVDSLLTLRYTIPTGSFTLPNRPALAEADGSPAVDHRLEWEAGLGLRVPNPFLWRIAYRGSAARALPDGAFDHTSTWRLSVEYSF